MASSNAQAHSLANLDAEEYVLVNRTHPGDYKAAEILPQTTEVIDEIKQWLSPTDYCSESSEYRKHLKSHLDGTGLWVTETEQYRKWHQTPETGTIWIKGVPGSGKSVIAASFIDRLAKTENVPVLFFFFFRYGSSKNRTPHSLVRDWLSQLLLYCPRLQMTLKEKKKQHSTLYDISLDELWEILSLALMAIPKVYCVADALDEMEEGHEKLLRQVLDLAAQKEPLKIIVTGRPNPSRHLEMVLHHPALLELCLEHHFVNRDIATYLEHRLKDSHSVDFSNEDRQLIKQAICAKGPGSFLYARLILDHIILKDPDNPLSLKLHRLPASMYGMYTKILYDHSVRSGLERRTQLFVLQCVTHAFWPLRLSELASLILSGAVQNKSCNLEEAKSLTRIACAPFLEIHEDETVQAIHHSLFEAVTDSGRTKEDGDPTTSVPPLVVESSSAHAMLALSCVRYICSGCFQPYISPITQGSYRSHSLANDGSFISQYPFMEYAALNLAHHISKYDGEEEEIFLALDDLMLRDDKTFRAYVDFLRLPRESCALHVAARYGLANYSKHLLYFGQSVNCMDCDRRTPISYAAAHGHSDVVAILLDSGANPELDIDIGLQPLHHAAVANNYVAVRLLLEAGVDPRNGRARVPHDIGSKISGDPPLKYACLCGHTQTVGELARYLGRDDLLRGLHWAAKYAKSETVSFLLDSRLLQNSFEIDTGASPEGSPVNVKDVDGNTPLFLAARMRDTETIRVLLDHGADASIKSQNGKESSLTLLHGWAELASLHERVDEGKLSPSLTLLLNSGCHIDAKNNGGKTALFHAISSGSIKMVSCLIENGASPSITDDSGNTPLHVTPSDATAITELLLNAGADVNARRSGDGSTPLLARLKLEADGPYSKTPLPRGTDCNAQDSESVSALHLSISRHFTHVDLTKRLLEAGADPNTRDSKGQTCLFRIDEEAVEYVDILLEILLSAGIDIEARDKRGRTALLSFAKRGDIALVRKLLDCGAKIDVCDFWGENVLHLISHAQSPSQRYKLREELVEELTQLRIFVQHGADPFSVDYAGNTILHRAAEHHKTRIRNRRLLIKAMLDLGAPSNTQNNLGRTTLHLAAMAFPETDESKTEESVLNIFLDPSMKIGINTRDRQGLTALHLASPISEYSVWTLLEAGADPFCMDEERRTPLHYASRGRQSNVVGLLAEMYKESGRDVDDVDVHGRTPLHDAARSGRIESVRYLILSGANPGSKDKSGNTPLHACAECQEEANIWSLLAPSDTASSRQHLVRMASQDPARRFKVTTSQYSWPRTLRIRSEFEICSIRDIVRVLLSAGASLTDINNDGLTASDLALVTRCEEVLDELLPAMQEHYSASADKSLSGNRKPKSLNPLVERWLTARNWQAADLIRSIDEKSSSVWEEFHGALRLGNWPLLMELIRSRRALLQSSDPGKKIVQQLTRWGLTSLVEEIGSGVLAVGGKIKPLLLAAAERKTSNIEMIRLLVKLGVDVNVRWNIRSSQGPTALHVLASSRYWWQPSALRYLIEAGAEINIQDDRGETPLHIALGGGFWKKDAVDILLAQGANVNSVTVEGLTPLNKAALRGAQITSELIRRGADLSRGDRPAIFSAISCFDVDTVRVLLEAGADCNAVNRLLQWPCDKDAPEPVLHFCGNLLCDTEERLAKASSIMTLLLHGGADASTRFKDGDTVFNHLVRQNGLIEPLLDYGVDLEMCNDQGVTPLLTACAHCTRWRYTDIQKKTRETAAIQLLLKGADVSAKDKAGNNAMHFLLKRCYPNDSVWQRLFWMLVERRVSITAKTADGLTPLLIALKESQPVVAAQLLDAGADSQPLDQDGNTALHLAADFLGRGQDRQGEELFERFNQVGVDPNARNNLGETNLFNYIRNVHTTPLRLLESEVKRSKHTFPHLRCDLWARNNQGQTLLHCAAKKTEKECYQTPLAIFRWLKEEGGLDPNLEDNNHQTPLDIVAAFNDQAVLKLFRE
ncbi:MAG: hypothetical protein M1837_003288 [Sclerophora amabilis]|nr:MAG: hypothetical protein M1837_003288 [Sclerophora amabilis]